MTVKIRRSIYWLIAIVTVFLGLVVWFANRKPVAKPSVAATDTNVAPQAANNPRQSISPAVHTNIPISNGATSPTSPQYAIGRKWETLSTYNDVLIDFYGKLEDQSGSPVAGADIKGTILVNNGTRDSTDHFSTTSDEQGFFEFHGRGESIGITPRREGYALASTGTFFRYSRLEDHPFVSDANGPTVIKMWKLQGAEPLLKINQNYKLNYTGEPIYFDLIAGTIVPSGGDMKLSVSRSPGVISGRNPMDWGVRIEAVDGGLMDADGQEGVTYIAPDNGYQPGTNFIFSTNPPYKWAGGFDQGFFMTSRNGQVYSKLGFSFNINKKIDEPMYITFRGTANTNGSRNWEGDPNIYKPQ